MIVATLFSLFLKTTFFNTKSILLGAGIFETLNGSEFLTWVIIVFGETLFCISELVKVKTNKLLIKLIY